MDLNIEEQTLIAVYRNLDEQGRRDLLRHASQQHSSQAASTPSNLSGQCRLERCEERPEAVAEPIFTE